MRVSVVHYTEIPDDFCPPQAVQPQQTEDFSALLAQMDVPYAYADVSALPSKLTPTGAKRLMPGAGEIEQAEDAPRVRFYQTPTGDGPYNARARGTATHLLLSLADVRRLRAAGRRGKGACPPDGAAEDDRAPGAAGQPADRSPLF